MGIQGISRDSKQASLEALGMPRDSVFESNQSATHVCACISFKCVHTLYVHEFMYSVGKALDVHASPVQTASDEECHMYVISCMNK